MLLTVVLFLHESISYGEPQMGSVFHSVCHVQFFELLFDSVLYYYNVGFVCSTDCEHVVLLWFDNGTCLSSKAALDK